jgi:hypothetical protein
MPSFSVQRGVGAGRHRTSSSASGFGRRNNIAITPANGVQRGVELSAATSARPAAPPEYVNTEDVENVKPHIGSVIRRRLTLPSGACPAAAGQLDPQRSVAGVVDSVHQLRRQRHRQSAFAV